VEIVTIATTGDRDAQSGDKSRWVLELERALAAGEIDLAVHSAKDVPGKLSAGLELLGAPARAAVEDVLCLREDLLSTREDVPSPREEGLVRPRPAAAEDRRPSLEALPAGARVGTSSLRREAQLRAAREDLEVVRVRGNVDTRLRKLGANNPKASGSPTGSSGADGAATDNLDAILLARAGLQRLGREAEIGAVLDPARFVPAPGQGTLALEGRAADSATREAVERITDATAFAALRAERAVAQALDASCATPLGVNAADAGCGCLHMHAWVGLPDGSAWIADELLGGFYDPEELGRRMAERLLSAGAGELLSRAQELATTSTQGPARPHAGGGS
jgi:hydroxymethylbilane synthase